MAKSKGKKKGKGGKRSNNGGVPSSAVKEVSTDTPQSKVWSAADECTHYATIGCHIANIARCCCGSEKSNKKFLKNQSLKCSEYSQMYKIAIHEFSWLLGIERFDSSDYHPEDIEHIPDVAMDDEQMELVLTNTTKDTTKICYVTVYDVDVCNANGIVLQSGISSTSNANIIKKDRKCTTFIILCPPQTFVHLCTLAPNQSTKGDAVPITSWSQIDIESDIQKWSYHPNVNDEHPYLLHFPFYGISYDKKEESLDNYLNEDAAITAPTAAAYQCTQSEDGQLTHFFHGNHHAIDFACPIGTPLYSPVDGIVTNVRDSVETNGGREEVSGIAASNMFYWNSIMIRVEEDTDATATSADPLYVEYVHIQSNSCLVKVGDTVTKGKLICRSGSVGFSPEPHLHLAGYRSNGDNAATVRIRFECIDENNNGSNGSNDEGTDTSFLPRAGAWYNQSGLVPSYTSTHAR